MKNLIMPVLLPFLFIINLFTVNIFSQETENDSSAYRNNVWFYSQRSAPNDTIPRTAYSNALSQKNSMSPGGYYLSTSWSNIGPVSMAYGSGTYSGRVTTCRFTADNRLFIGAAEGGVWEATNLSTLNWTDHSAGLASLSSGCIAISLNADTVYYGSGESVTGTLYSYMGLGVFKSVDGGASWTNYHIISGSDPIIYKIAIKPTDNTQLIAATSTGLYRSTNAGMNWSVVSGTSSLPATDVTFTPVNGDTAYAVGPPGGIGYLRSTDGGTTFSAPSHGPTIGGRTEISICHDYDNYIYIVTAATSPDTMLQVFRSTNAGNSFTATSTPFYDPVQLGFNLCIAVKPDDPATLFTGAVYLYKSTNSGAFFVGTGGDVNIHPDFHDLTFRPGYPNTVAAVSDGGVFLSTNCGTNWSSLNNSQLPLAQVYRIGTTASQIYGGLQDEGFTHVSTQGTTWSLSFGGDGTGIAASKFSDVMIVGYGNGGDISKIINGTFNKYWPSDWLGYWDGRGYDWVAAVASHPTHPDEFYTARHDLSNHSQINFKRLLSGDTTWVTLSSMSSPFQPQNVEFSKTNPHIVYLGTSGKDETNNFGREIWKSVDSGVHWGTTPIVVNNSPVMAELYITRIVTAPSDISGNEDDVYATLSGFLQGGGSGHVYRSTNGGTNWSDISGNLPNAPVNALLVTYPDCSTKLLTAATDIGVFCSTNNGSVWKALAAGMPNTVVTDLEYNPATSKIKASTFGRSIYEVYTSPDANNVYITGIVTLTGDNTINQNINVCSGGYLKIYDNTIIRMAAGTKISVQDGGRLDANTGSIFQSQNGQKWNGIEFHGGGYGTITGATINFADKSVNIDGSGATGTLQNINITSCTFDNSYVQIKSRDNVLIDQCAWSYYDGTGFSICGVSTAGSNNISVQRSTINYSTSMTTSTGISITNGTGAVISKNTINNTSIGIYVSSNTPSIQSNTISNTDATQSNIGISLNGCSSANVSKNIIKGYQEGFNLVGTSSPVMFRNSAINTNTSGTTIAAMFCDNTSSPRLTPTISGGVTIWDAGEDTLKSTNAGDGIWVDHSSQPNIDGGYNIIYGSVYYLHGQNFGASRWSVTYNCWVDAMPTAGKFLVTGTTITYSPYTCSPPPGAPPGGGIGQMSNEKWQMSNEKTGTTNDKGQMSNDNVNFEMRNPKSERAPSEQSAILNLQSPIGAFEDKPAILTPPQPMIVDYGNGVLDTLHVTSSTVQLPADKVMYFAATKQSLEGSFQQAVNTYKQVIQSYPDSSSAVESMKKIFYCYARMNSDSNVYTNLRSYYSGLTSNNLACVKVAAELSRKCLVKKRQYAAAINEYEYVVQHSTDSTSIVSAEVSIIETYLLIHNGGDSPGFTGSLGYLKPLNALDAMRMIQERLFKLHNNVHVAVIPKKFSLSQNYPNPFNPATNISYNLPKSAKVVIKVYDIIGRVVKELVNEDREAGSYTVSFDGTNLASGIYFYKIEANQSDGKKFVDTKKMVLIK
jgi:parallel beta-helix repeat protein